MAIMHLSFIVNFCPNTAVLPAYNKMKSEEMEAQKN